RIVIPWWCQRVAMCVMDRTTVHFSASYVAQYGSTHADASSPHRFRRQALVSCSSYSTSYSDPFPPAVRCSSLSSRSTRASVSTRLPFLEYPARGHTRRQRHPRAHSHRKRCL
ncbi:hypothetical protein BD413DRAFT_561619, partial [Trametes elegans]